MPSYPTEKRFENHIIAHLLNHGYRKALSSDYDTSLCLIPPEVIAFIQATQPQQWQKLEQQYGPDTARRLCERLEKEISQRGTLDVLRKGIETRGCKFKLVYFQPANHLNPDHQAQYKQNRFSIIQQFYFSANNQKSLDLGIFINGLPILTAELKNSTTGQFVEQAIEQYKTDRDPQEPLFRFKRCLVHFAVGNEKVFMTTRLAKDKTHFLPFNLDTDNPVNPNGYRTHYLWEQIWQTDSLLNLLQNYLHLQTSTEKVWKDDQLIEIEKEQLIFPRFHQLDAVRSLISTLKQDGTGRQYLIQHSAGSGKSNSIAWLAHQLANFYREPHDTRRLFDSIIVITDRRVLDKQLQNTIKQFEQTQGVVAPIDKNAAQLKQAIETGQDIIITTLQKFPVISNSISQQSGKRFAVIIDEAHSSQSGESTKHLNQSLTAGLDPLELAEAAESQPETTEEDAVIEEIRARSRHQPHISYFAFTATPKEKTLQTFGHLNAEGQYVPFHSYTMRQAIEEGFILDVLQNYTTYERYFKLHQKYDLPTEFDKRKAAKLLVDYVDLQPHAFAAKSRIILDHFLSKVADQLNGRARAMVCTRSRLHAVRYFQTLSRLMQEMNLPYKPLVAFSGTVEDPEIPDVQYTETSLNQLPGKTDIPDALKMPQYRILIVAKKYQTGFDEPLLQSMYVDTKLGGVSTVQTLSRLNRTTSGKEHCMVLDFVNSATAIQSDFQSYYQTTALTDTPDPDRLYDLKNAILNYEIFTTQDVENFAAIFWDKTANQDQLQPILDAVRDAWHQCTSEARETFRSHLQRFIRFYGFLAQVITFEDVDLEKFYGFVRLLNRKLDPRESGRIPTELLDAVRLDSFKIERTFEDSIPLTQVDTMIRGMRDREAAPQATSQRDTLTNIITRLNETYGVNLTEDDKLDIERIRNKVENNSDLEAVMIANNTEQVKREKFNSAIDEIFLEFIHDKLDLYKKLKTPEFNKALKQEWFEEYSQRFFNQNAPESEA
ncbi:MAG: restriction endonuclease subunit R [Alkalinema sp. CACIAM 70d]|nr:MAG: restriction endonuclease subunit R [Alkalinema sp. CACIAM 70d]